MKRKKILLTTILSLAMVLGLVSKSYASPPCSHVSLQIFANVTCAGSCISLSVDSSNVAPCGSGTGGVITDEACCYPIHGADPIVCFDGNSPAGGINCHSANRIDFSNSCNQYKISIISGCGGLRDDYIVYYNGVSWTITWDNDGSNATFQGQPLFGLTQNADATGFQVGCPCLSGCLTDQGLPAQL